MSDPLTEDDIQPTVDAAIEGDVYAFECLQRIPYSPKNRTILRHAFPAVSCHLQFVLPPSNPFDAICSKEEKLALIALLFIHNSILEARGKEDGPIHSLIMASCKDIFRWMCHFYSAYIFNGEHHLLVQNQERAVYRKNLTHLWIVASSPTIDRELVEDLVPQLLSLLQRYPSVIALMKDDPSVGSLRAQLYMVGCRDKTDEAALCHVTHWLLHKPDVRLLVPCDEAFYQTFVQHSAMFAKAVSKRIWDYTTDPLGSEDLMAFIVPLSDCGIYNNVVDACIEQNGFVRAVTLILTRAVDGVRSVPLDVESREGALVIIILSLRIISANIGRGGPSLAAFAIREGLLSSFMKLRCDGTLARGAGLQIIKNDMDKELVTLVEHLQKMIIYPVILFLPATADFSEEYKASKAKTKAARSGLAKFDEALDHLRSRIDNEFVIFNGVIKQALRATSFGSNPYKFCDNSQCPSIGKLTCLGRCESCLSGYYCSRHCQKIAWANGHRQECKLIGETKGGFIPLLTTHDREYLNRTTIPRSHYYGGGEEITEGSVFDMIFTLPPFGVRRRSHNDLGVPGPVVRAMYPTYGKLDLDDMLCISLGGATSLMRYSSVTSAGASHTIPFHLNAAQSARIEEKIEAPWPLVKQSLEERLKYISASGY